MAPRRKKNNKAIPIGEHVRIAVDLKLREFLNAHDQVELEFPNSLTSVERAYVHELVRKYGLKSKSKGKGDTRFLTIYKRNGSSIVQADCQFTLSKNSYQAIHKLLSSYPLQAKEKCDIEPVREKTNVANFKLQCNKDPRTSTGRLNQGIPVIPTISSDPELETFRRSLPVFMYKSNILQLINDNQVVLISGETGSGKTTQIPQYIMDEASLQKKPCRIVCTQPRRISAISICGRVAQERNTNVGQGVGYQIRLESRVSPHTGLIYCTTGVLLRTLMGADNCFSSITHVIVDEIHERDKFSDYLLIVLRDCLHKHPNLKLILMSATVDTKLFTTYFKNCPTLKIPGRLFPVKSYFLEDVLKSTNYCNKEMQKFKALIRKKKNEQEVQKNWTDSFRNMSISSPSENVQCLDTSSDTTETTEMSDDLKDMMDKCLQDFWMYGSADYFGQILHFILNEDVSVNYQHRVIGCTILMLAAGRGYPEHTEHILNLGADATIRSCNNWTAYDWAAQSGQTECAQLILAYTETTVETASSRANELLYRQSTAEDKELLEAYSHSFNSDESVDHELIMHVILHLHTGKDDGGILVFLPGYEDIMQLRDLVLKEDRMRDRPYQLYILHSNMHTVDHKQVFQRLDGIRKIILSTNIAETSITIDHVVYVVDSGKVKEVTFDGVSGTTCLRTNWISRACALQRAGRAGRVRPGECYHLFSSARFHEVMQQFTTPEILRTPLQELCLQTKLLAPVHMPIAEFLDKAVEPPPAMVTRQAVQLLKMIGALDESEDLTEMGVHMVDIPLDPKLSKMLMYGVALKCLDPILTIACCLAHREPFMLPTQPSDKRTLTACRKKFAADTFSDHMVLLRVFQAWQNARQSKCERPFCAANFVNAATMEQIVSTRAQMLGQLRASGFVKARGPYDVKDLNMNSENWAVIKAAITASLYPALARIDKECMTLRTQSENKVWFHPSSTLKADSSNQKPSTAMVEALKSAPSDWMVYEEKSRVGPWCHIKTVTMITPITVALFGGPIRAPSTMVSETPVVELSSDSDSESETQHAPPAVQEKTNTYAVDDWALFKLQSQTAQNIYELRCKWNSLFIRRMMHPSKIMSQSDEVVLDTVVRVLTEEDLKAGFVQLVGIGQRPKALTTEGMSPTLYQNFAHHRMANGANTRTVTKPDGSDGRQTQPNWRQRNEFGTKNVPGNSNEQAKSTSQLKLTKYYVFTMEDTVDGMCVYRPKIKVNDDFAVFFKKVIQDGGHVYLIFLSKNRKKFEGVAEVFDRDHPNKKHVTSSKGRFIHLNWLSRTPVPITGSGVGTSVDVSAMHDGFDLGDEFGRALKEYLISYRLSLYNNSEQYYARSK